MNKLQTRFPGDSQNQIWLISGHWLRGRIVQINDKSMKIGIQGNFDTLLSKQSGSILDFAQEGRNLQSKMTDIENVNFLYNFKLNG